MIFIPYPSLGCWGYSLNIQEDGKKETTYFNMDGSTNEYVEYFYIKLGFTYKFTLTPLPSGKPLVIETKAPSKYFTFNFSNFQFCIIS